jgi:MFS family permease
VDPFDSSYRWWVLVVTSIGALMASLTGGTLIIALPEILRDLHTDIFSLLWIVVGYTLVATVLVLNAGRIADMVGRARSYTLGFVIFTAASVMCALAPDATQLIAWRLVQGVGGALLMANATALVTDAFPRIELGRALGINAMVIGAGAILGPILGGWLTGFGWRTIFWFNVPIGLIGVVAAGLILVEQVPHDQRWLWRSAACTGGRHGGSSAVSSPSSWQRRPSCGSRHITTPRCSICRSSAIDYSPWATWPDFSMRSPGTECCSCWSSTSRAPGAKTL